MGVLFSLLLLVCVSGACFAAEPVVSPQSAQVEKKAGKAKIIYKGGDGSSVEKAVVICGAKNSMDGVPAEYAWLGKKYKGYETVEQALLNVDGKSYDRVTIKTKRGKEVVVYFDISEFMGGK